MSTRPPTRQSGIETQARILAAALARFSVEGFQGTSIRDLANDAGVTMPALYYHFGSKDGIMAAIINPLIDAGETLLDELSESSMNRRQLADRALEGYYDLIVDHLDVFLFVETDRSVRSHPEAGHRLADQASRFLDLVSRSRSRPGRVQAAAALGAIRRPLRLKDVDPKRDRKLILGCARAVLDLNS